MAIADMFLKMRGQKGGAVTGEAGDTDHKGEIEVVSWSWGMKGSYTGTYGGSTRKATIDELHVVKHVDRSSPVLMNMLRTNENITNATLTVRKAGKTPLEYLKIELEDARVHSVTVESVEADLVERLSLGFSKVRVTYTPQDPTGARGGGDISFEDNLSAE